MECINCKSSQLDKIIDIGSQPISSVFPTEKKYDLKEYSLDVFKCEDCELVQFGSFAPLDDMYGSTYGYRTSLSGLMINHMRTKYDKLINNNILKENSLILDIGSNDGTFLNFFASNERNFRLHGIDPSAGKFNNYYNKKINLMVDYFSEKTVSTFFNDNKVIDNKFSLITSFAMFYDLEDPNAFCKDIRSLLDEDGIWISEFSYFPLLLKNLTYDQICHEHVAYYTLSTFQKIANQNGLKVIDISFNNINGGSIEVICTKEQSNHKQNTKLISEILEDEKKIDNSAYKRCNERISNTKKMLQLFLESINSEDIIGYGAATKGNIVLNQCEITSKELPFICDENPYKFDKYTPGSNIKIISKDQMRQKKPKYLLILIWSFRSEVIKQEEEYIKAGGKLIFHLPMFHIIDKDNYMQFIHSDFKSFSYDY
jgi:NDP-4-keto-2,6-dideoxyhexose 3-C-methyltransferase